MMTHWTDPHLPDGVLTEKDREIIRELFAAHSHTCAFSDEERQLLKDVASGGKVVKRVVIYIIAALLLLSFVSESAIRKLAQMIGIMK